MSNFSQKNVLQKAGPNTEKYGPRSGYGFLRIGCRPIRMQDPLKPYNNIYCYIASAKTKRDWLIHGHVTLDKCNVSIGQQVNNCCPAAYINKQNGGESCKFENSDFRAFCLKKYTIDREDMLLKLKFNY